MHWTIYIYNTELDARHPELFSSVLKSHWPNDSAFVEMLMMTFLASKETLPKINYIFIFKKILVWLGMRHPDSRFHLWNVILMPNRNKQIISAYWKFINNGWFLLNELNINLWKICTYKKVFLSHHSFLLLNTRWQYN